MHDTSNPASSSVSMHRSILIGLFLVIFTVTSIKAHAKEVSPLPSLEGVWFTCEFATRRGPPDDSCIMFDDEGFAVVDSNIKYIRNIASKENACRGNKAGQCFPANEPAITISERKIGAARIEGRQLLVSYLGCTQKFDLLPQADYVSVIPAKDKCFWTRNRHFYVAPYKGKLNRQ